MLVSTEKKTNRRPFFELYQVDFASGKKEQIGLPVSEYHYVFNGPNSSGTSFIAGKQTKKKRDLFLSKITEKNAENPVFQKRKIIPRSIEISGNGQVLMVLGEDKMATIDSTTLQLISRNRLPFDVLRGALNQQGDVGIIQENSGSEIGFVDTVKGDVVKQIGAGRVFAKAGNFIATQFTGVLATVLNYFQSSKQLQFNHNEQRLMVINSNSNDITIFDVQNKKKLAARSTGTLTQLMVQFKNVPDVVLTMNRNQINIFNTQSGEELMELKSTDLVGIDQTRGFIFYQDFKGMHQLSLQSVSQTKTYTDVQALGVYSIQ